MGETYRACRRDEKCLWNFDWGILKGRDYFRDPGVDEWIILKCMLKKRNVSGYEPTVGFENGNDPLGSIKAEGNSELSCS